LLISNKCGIDGVIRLDWLGPVLEASLLDWQSFNRVWPHRSAADATWSGLSSIGQALGHHA